MYEDTPMRKIGTEIEMLMYGDTPLGWDIAGTKEIIASVNRDNFVSYMNRLYVPSNAVVSIAGGLAVSASLVESYFGKWQSRMADTFAPVSLNQQKPRVKVISKKTEQTHLALGVHSYKLTDSRRYMLSLLSVILGGGMSSRLFHEVRERRGLAYYVRSESNKYADTGNFVITAGVETSKLKDAVAVIISELAKIARKPVAESELQRAKEYVKGHLTLELEDSQEVASLHGMSLLLEGQVRTPEQIVKGIDSVSLSDISQVARDIFKQSSLNLAVIGPFKKTLEKELVDLLQL